MPILGYENYLYINTGTTESPTWTEIDLARDVNIGKDKNEINADRRATARNGWGAVEDGLKNWSVDFDTLVPASDEDANAAFTALEAAYRANTSVEVLRTRGAAISVDGTYAEKVTCGVFGGAEGEPLNDMMTISFSLKAKAVPAFGTVSSSAFVEGS